MKYILFKLQVSRQKQDFLWQTATFSDEKISTSIEVYIDKIMK